MLVVVVVVVDDVDVVAGVVYQTVTVLRVSWTMIVGM